MVYFTEDLLSMVAMFVCRLARRMMRGKITNAVILIGVLSVGFVSLSSQLKLQWKRSGCSQSSSSIPVTKRKGAQEKNSYAQLKGIAALWHHPVEEPSLGGGDGHDGDIRRDGAFHVVRWLRSSRGKRGRILVEGPAWVRIGPPDITGAGGLTRKRRRRLGDDFQMDELELEKEEGKEQEETYDPHELNEKWSDVPLELIQYAPEVFNKVPHKFEANYKNPCWYGKSRKLYCLPHFYLIGSQRCGTSDLWDKITTHPDVVAQMPKEPHWWARRRLGWTDTSIHPAEVGYIRRLTRGKDDSSFEWYLNWFRAFGLQKLRSRQTINEEGKRIYPMVFGDASATTAFDVTLQWHGEMGNYTNAQLLHAVQPGAKIIMVVRNPAERDFSEHRYNNEGSADDFNRLAVKRVACFTECLLQFSERYCTYLQKCNVSASLYAVYLKDWIDVYGKEGVHVMRLEDWQTNAAEEYQKIISFLGLRKLTSAEIQIVLARKRVNVNAAKAKEPSMSNSTREALTDFYRPYNLRLGQLLGDSKFAYNEL